MADTEPQVTVLVREYVEITYAASPKGKDKVIFPREEVNDMVVSLASLLPNDGPPVKTRGPGSTGV